MKIYEGEALEKYKKENLKFNNDWNERDFVSGVENYFNASTEKILAISGLRGTGKTTGILQAAKSLDAVYILAQDGEEETGKDYINFLKSTDKKYIIIDEYGWIKDRDCLDKFLLTCVQNDKRLVITGTESISLDFLNYGSLIHRLQTLHTTMFTYEEYLRVFNKEHSKEVCKEYLLTGGLFEDYVLKNFDTTKNYIESAIVKNLSGYLKNEMSEEKAKTLTYAVLYKAICPSNLQKIPTLRDNHVTLENFLERMGINTTLLPEEKDLNRVADIFEQIGLIVRIPNFNEKSDLKEQYYIVNPSLTCQLIMAAYNLSSLGNTELGHVFESSVATQLATNKLSDHKIYFYNNGSIKGNPDNKELDLIITDIEKENAFFFECKFTQTDKMRSDITLLTGFLEENDFKDIDIEGRYVIYNGKPLVKYNYDVGTIIFAPIGKFLDYYFEFEENIKNIEADKVINRLNNKIDSEKISEKIVNILDETCSNELEIAKEKLSKNLPEKIVDDIIKRVEKILEDKNQDINK